MRCSLAHSQTRQKRAGFLSRIASRASRADNNGSLRSRRNIMQRLDLPDRDGMIRIFWDAFDEAVLRVPQDKKTVAVVRSEFGKPNSRRLSFHPARPWGATQSREGSGEISGVSIRTPVRARPSKYKPTSSLPRFQSARSWGRDSSHHAFHRRTAVSIRAPVRARLVPVAPVEVTPSFQSARPHGRDGSCISW